MNIFWILLCLWAIVAMISDYGEIREKGYWQVTKERNQRIFGGAFKVGSFCLRSYMRHHK